MTEIIQIDSNTWSIEDGFVRFFLLVGEDKALMIDSGVNSPDAAIHLVFLNFHRFLQIICL